MNRAFIFDMDGVLINTEIIWNLEGQYISETIFGKELDKRIGNKIGMSIADIYEKAVSYGFVLPKEDFYKYWDEHALKIYEKATITRDIDKLVEHLIRLKFKLGLVSSSRPSWIQHVLNRISFTDKLDCIISLNEHDTLRSKPHPDGYKHAMQLLHATPKSTIILEDSNTGIASARASKGFTIGFRGHLVSHYQQNGADVYADTIDEVIMYVDTLIKENKL